MPPIRHLDGILISVTGYRWNPGSQNIVNSLSRKEFVQFQVYMAEQLKMEFVRAIDNQRYRKDVRKWPPLTLNYLRYKKKHSLSLNIWEATGHLKKSIKVFNRGSYVVVGFKRNDYYPNTKLQVNKVAQYVEYGGVRMKPRPLFRALTIYIRKNINSYYKKFLKEVLKRK